MQTTLTLNYYDLKEIFAEYVKSKFGKEADISRIAVQGNSWVGFSGIEVTCTLEKPKEPHDEFLDRTS